MKILNFLNKKMDFSKSKNNLAHIAGFTLFFSAAITIFFREGLLNSLQRGIWTDEAFSIYFVQGTWHSLFLTMRYFEANMGLYYVLLKIWGAIGGWNEMWLRSLSLIFFIVGVLVTACGVKKISRNISAISTVLLLMTHYFLVRYSVEIRAYSLAFLFLALGWYFWLQLFIYNKDRYFFPYIVVGVLAGYAHFFTIFGFGALALAALPLTFKNAKWKRLLAPNIVILIFWIPLFAFVLNRDNGQLSWVTPVNLHSIIYMAYMFVGAAPQLNDTIKHLILGGTIILIIKKIFIRLYSNSTNKLLRYEEVSLLALTVVPIFIGYLISLRSPVFVDRFFVFFVPFFLAYLSIIIFDIENKIIKLTIFILFLLSLSSATIEYGERASEPWKLITEKFQTDCDKSQTVVFMMPFTQIAVNYYLSQSQKHCKIKFAPYKLGYKRPSLSVYSDERNPPLLTNKQLDSKAIWLVDSHIKSSNDLDQKNLYLEQIKKSNKNCLLPINYFGIRLIKCI